jgi:hypothetical protein
MKTTFAALLLACASAAHAASPMAVRVLDWTPPVPANRTPQVPSSDMRLFFPLRGDEKAIAKQYPSMKAIVSQIKRGA